jgi:RNA 3'-terminal phosphate cyclase (ATP)
MANRAVNVLKNADIVARIEAAHVEATGPGAGIFLCAEYEHGAAGFTAYGRKGLPSEQVASMVCDELLAYHKSDAAADPHLADQLVLPAALASGASQWTTSCITQHLLTNAWVVNHFLDVPIQIAGQAGEPGHVIIGQSSSAN